MAEGVNADGSTAKALTDFAGFEKQLRGFFGGPVIFAVSEMDDFSFPGLIEVKEVFPEAVVASMWVDIGKDFYMEIHSWTVTGPDEWHIITPRQRWAFRRVSDAVAASFTTYLSTYGTPPTPPTPEGR